MSFIRCGSTDFFFFNDFFDFLIFLFDYIFLNNNFSVVNDRKSDSSNAMRFCGILGLACVLH